jgi:hypothetical protein
MPGSGAGVILIEQSGKNVVNQLMTSNAPSLPGPGRPPTGRQNYQPPLPNTTTGASWRMVAIGAYAVTLMFAERPRMQKCGKAGAR